METKKDIRKYIYGVRKKCTDQEIEKWSRMITDKIVALPCFIQAERVMVYADYNHEVITRYIIEEAWKQKKEVAVPKVCGKDMIFYRLTDFAQLEEGYYGIPEPTEGETADWQEALMIMPGVAFDRANHRVGYGGGFYDRFLEKHPALIRVAAAFEFQILDQVPAEATDILPQIIVTEEKIYELSNPKEGI